MEANDEERQVRVALPDIAAAWLVCVGLFLAIAAVSIVAPPSEGPSHTKIQKAEMVFMVGR